MLSDELETRHNNMNSNIKVTSFVPKYAFKITTYTNGNTTYWKQLRKKIGLGK